MAFSDRVQGSGIMPRSLRGKKATGAVVAILGAGAVVVLAGCGPIRLASSGGHAGTGTGQSTTARPGSSGMGTQGGGTTSAIGGSYSFTTIDDPADLTFNQLLGINNRGTIAGYFGSGAAGHPNKGFQLRQTGGGYAIHNENFPESVQTQVTGLNDVGTTVGFWSSMNNANQTNDNTGFYDIGGSFHSVQFPTSDNANPPVNQLLGVNNYNVAVGFYTDSSGNNHGYTYSISSGQFQSVTVPDATSLTASAINNRGDVAGFDTTSSGANDAFLLTSGRHDYTLAYPGASATQALGVNDYDDVVGVYTVGTGSNATMHGFTWAPGRGFHTVDDPNGAGTTTINGVNDEGDIVGFYVDGSGNTDGFAAAPGGQGTFPGLAAGAGSSSPSMSQPSSTPSDSSLPTAPSSPSTSATPSASQPMPSSTPTSDESPQSGAPTQPASS
jgi:hypothetical protein